MRKVRGRGWWKGREKDGSGTAGTGGCFWISGKRSRSGEETGKAVSAALPDFDCLVDAACHNVGSRPVEI